MKKENELINCYEEAMKRAQKEMAQKKVSCLKEVLEEKIGDQKDKGLEYKVLCKTNSNVDVVTVAFAMLAIFLPLIIDQTCQMAKFVSESFAELVASVLVAVVIVYVICFLRTIQRYVKRVIKYKEMSIIVDEIYEERFKTKKDLINE